MRFTIAKFKFKFKFEFGALLFEKFQRLRSTISSLYFSFYRRLCGIIYRNCRIAGHVIPLIEYSKSWVNYCTAAIFECTQFWISLVCSSTTDSRFRSMFSPLSQDLHITLYCPKDEVLKEKWDISPSKGRYIDI
jgi:hypothetical protein